MRNRDTREALTPTEPEMSPVKTDDYPLLVEESPAGKRLDATWLNEVHIMPLNEVSQILLHSCEQ